jgi:hypothetical protein
MRTAWEDTYQVGRKQVEGEKTGIPLNNISARLPELVSFNSKFVLRASQSI